MTATNLSALIFDTETSGLFNYQKRADEPGQPRMVSLAAALLDTEGNVLHEIYRLIKPDGWEENFIEDCKAGKGAFAVNGLTWERLNDEGVPIAHALMEYDALVDRCEGIAAYGVNFDQKVVRAEQRRAGRDNRYGERPVFCLQRPCTDLCKIPPTDKMMATGRKWNKTPKLSEAVKILLGVDLEDAHDAKADLGATIDLYRLLIREHPALVVWNKQESKLKSEEA